MMQTTTSPKSQQATRDELRHCLQRARAPRLRTLRQFACDEIVLPKGKYKGLKLQIDRQPFVGLLFDEIDSGRWNRTATVGCVQSGKTTNGTTIPLVYYLFEHRDTAIYGLPTMDMAGDKWREEVLPVIKASRYRKYLPLIGRGSRAGSSNLEAVTFTNGVTLKFMSARGGDERRSGFTSRIVIVTEVDKADKAASTSRETDPISQMESRALSYDESERRTHLECTVSIPQGRIWREYSGGTASRIACPCPHCQEYVTPEREHLVGWREAESKIEAGDAARWSCPACAATLTERDRREMNLRAKLVHRGQTIDATGVIHGDAPRTDTLGFRWNAFNNLFWTARTVGQKEWTAAHAEDEDEAEKELLQFWWVKPYEPPQLDTTTLEVDTLRRRCGTDRRGFVPDWADRLTLGVDIGKYVGWWIAMAWRLDGSGHVVDYGQFEVPGQSIAVEQAILAALREFRDDTVAKGWPQGPDGVRLPDQVWIDSGYKPEAITAFCRESGPRYLPSDGLGVGQHFHRVYTKPTKTGSVVRHIGLNYHLVYRPESKSFFAEVNADWWKCWLHEGLAIPGDEPGAIRFYHSSDANEHLSLAKHLTAEKQTEEFLPGKGKVTKWVRLHRKNHWFDCAYNACAAAHFRGVRRIAAARKDATSNPRTPAQESHSGHGLTTPDGRPFMITERTA